MSGFGDFDVLLEVSGEQGPARSQAEADRYHEAQQAVVEANARKRAERLVMKEARRREATR